MKDATKMLKRHPANPLIKPEDYPGVSQIFNPSPAMYKNKTVLLLSMCFFNSMGGETRVAESEDGIHFKIDDRSFINLADKPFPYDIVNQHIIDNRVTKIGDTYYILTPVGTAKYDVPCTVLGKTKDFKSYEVIEIITLPQNRGASLFPEKIGGKYYKLDRPRAGRGFGSIWLSSSPDLIHWGCYRPLLAPGYTRWAGEKIGPTPPIKTDKGWLVIIHGVRTTLGIDFYSLGAVLLDIENPCRIIGKTISYLLTPEKDYEINGVSNNVVFACGAIADGEKDELRLYYGGADKCICLATGSLSEIADACIKQI
ncbi:MAG: glycoside hydrolase family 130 protein [Candidatus Omnitrophica bacterium]|nr:glycoside hydrolase family 130 protein [Candidatus Omnitrophota bacterium]